MSLNYAFMADLIGRYAGSHRRVLDYGCGEGQLVAAAVARGHDAHGCDSYEGLWSMWTDAGNNERIVKIDGSGRVPFPDESFDVVIANQVFEHIKEIEQPL